ncbi:MAG: family ATPase [Acidimicrobiales bacterium]|nr:family ATPase [Acidimicrobiales bacterium]
MLVTLSGLPGSGTSTVARPAAAALGIEHLDGGTAFRAFAAEEGLSLAEFAQRAEVDPTIDQALDRRLADRIAAGDVLVESRLAGWWAHRGDHAGLRVWIDCDERERARRVGSRDGHDLADALATNRSREASERARYLEYYGIDLTDLTIYDLVLDSTSTGPDELVDRIVAAARGNARAAR